MKELFPKEHVLGFVGSLLLTLAALTVIMFKGMSNGLAMTILLITAAAQALVQLILFMHIGETDDKKSLYVTIIYAVVVGLITVFGTLLAMVWGY
ncbi:cytochrome aa3 quinol oxidase subunit IV [Rummeliibacillus sp. G93]|uniref:cytochrome aa3 quinol oxidase subunit IV n=1 Tax=Rummeliibacillus TaxID=648802 RepID=UPI0011752BA3|nr:MULTISPECIES: cytochrome aa3 quinol oxidase subunit IV [Rummeliibacillus]MBB5170019.1 cytochrome aa3-600 menaquinol oxidase subunit 4 [Rummeliibacillus stabekisii]MCM3315678.1 cytochrome aa3 quinol oxidase subunit IV [Rummeliibacillus stabekisii]UQW98251.1 cytochrome aa3 quinol oxidase subunit IV [Rummeliibacillus sp. G93]GEL04277.1 cytochrome aa3 quinol oxidase subunit IV [Rummeliibacillus stabekisii]